MAGGRSTVTSLFGQSTDLTAPQREDIRWSCKTEANTSLSSKANIVRFQLSNFFFSLIRSLPLLVGEGEFYLIDRFKDIIIKDTLVPSVTQTCVLMKIRFLWFYSYISRIKNTKCFWGHAKRQLKTAKKILQLSWLKERMKWDGMDCAVGIQLLERQHWKTLGKSFWEKLSIFVRWKRHLTVHRTGFQMPFLWMGWISFLLICWCSLKGVPLKM